LATAGDQPRRRRRIDAALLQGYESATDRFEQTYLLVSSHLGFRLRQSLTIRQFAIAVGALAEGCALRNRVDALNMEGIVRPTGSGGREQGWTLFAIGLEALVHQFLELDPDWSPVEDEG
jgi:hypothetical protein